MDHSFLGSEMQMTQNWELITLIKTNERSSIKYFKSTTGSYDSRTAKNAL